MESLALTTCCKVIDFDCNSFENFSIGANSCKHNFIPNKFERLSNKAERPGACLYPSLCLSPFSVIQSNISIIGLVTDDSLKSSSAASPSCGTVYERGC